MKYLKLFEDNGEDIKNFSDTLFVDLKDNDFSILTAYHNKNNSIYVEVYIYKNSTIDRPYPSNFFYSDIEDEVKTFIDYMRRKWEYIDIIYKYDDLHTSTRVKSKEPTSSTRIVGSTTGNPPSLTLIIRKLNKKPNYFNKITKQFHHTWREM